MEQIPRVCINYYLERHILFKDREHEFEKIINVVAVIEKVSKWVEEVSALNIIYMDLPRFQMAERSTKHLYKAYHGESCKLYPKLLLCQKAKGVLMTGRLILVRSLARPTI